MNIIDFNCFLFQTLFLYCTDFPDLNLNNRNNLKHTLVLLSSHFSREFFIHSAATACRTGSDRDVPNAETDATRLHTKSFADTERVSTIFKAQDHTGVCVTADGRHQELKTFVCKMSMNVALVNTSARKIQECLASTLWAATDAAIARMVSVESIYHGAKVFECFLIYRFQVSD